MDIKMNWNEMTPAERVQWCDDHKLTAIGIRTILEWNDMSPTMQLFLKNTGIENKATWEA